MNHYFNSYYVHLNMSKYECIINNYQIIQQNTIITKLLDHLRNKYGLKSVKIK